MDYKDFLERNGLPDTQGNRAFFHESQNMVKAFMQEIKLTKAINFINSITEGNDEALRDC